MNWFELSVKVGADESVPVSSTTIYSFCSILKLLRMITRQKRRQLSSQKHIQNY